MPGLDLVIGGQQAVFFSDQKIKSLADKGQRKSLSQCGAYTATTAKQSLRYVGKKNAAASAPAGRPPFARRSERFRRKTTNKKTGVSKDRATSPLKELIFFGFDPQRKSVVIGPIQFRGAARKSYLVPTALEKGASVQVRLGGRRVRARIAPHPFMAPALKKNLPKFKGTFKNSFWRG